MAKVDALEGKISTMNAKVMFIEPFIQTMGDPREYEYRGECVDLGRVAGACICGHPIRYEFIVHHKTNDKTVILGSECVLHFQFIAPELYASLVEAVAKLQKDLAEAKKQAKLAKVGAEIDELKPIYDSLYKKLLEVYGTYTAKRSWKNPCPVPYKLWSAWREIHKNPPEFQRKSAYVAWYKRNTKKIDELVQEFCKEA